jgi:hypothetical protein
VQQIRQRLTYANVMSSIAVFFVLGGATAFAATKIGANELKANAVLTGKIKKEAVTAAKLKNGAITTGKIANGAVDADRISDSGVTTAKIASGAVISEKLADNAVTTTKIAADAVTGAKVNESTLGEVPLAAEAKLAGDAKKVGGQTAASFVARADLLWAVVREDGSLVGGFGATAATRTSVGRFTVTFNRAITTCVTQGTATDVTGGEPPLAAGARIIGTDNRVQDSGDASKVNVTTTNPAGALEDPEPADGFTVTVYC